MDPVPENKEVPIIVAKDSQTASEFIDQQLALEADAREVLPYKFDKCTNVIGPLRQPTFACLTCSPPPASAAQVYTPAGVCYACSISCHGEHTLVELFSRRSFVCDCGTSRLPSTSSCTLRFDHITGSRGVHSEEPHKGNRYNKNYQNRFCVCDEEYDAETQEGTMYQCMGLGTVETGGCGEDWYHPECLVGLPRDWYKSLEPKEVVKDGEEIAAAEEPSHPVPPDFPNEGDFETMICYKCVESNPWIKRYAGTPGFLPPLFRKNDAETALQPAPKDVTTSASNAVNPSLKRKASDSDIDTRPGSPSKRVKDESVSTSEQISPAAASADPSATTNGSSTATETGDLDSKQEPKHAALPPSPPPGTFSLFLKADFREHLCHCASCYPNLIPHHHLLEEEDIYEPSLSDSSSDDSDPHQDGSRRSSRVGSLYDRGEAALSNIDRVRAIEGVMVYNQLRDKVKAFLKPYAEEGRVVSAEDVKAYFEKLRGDTQGIKEARDDAAGSGSGDGGGSTADGSRREQSGY